MKKLWMKGISLLLILSLLMSVALAAGTTGDPKGSATLATVAPTEPTEESTEPSEEATEPDQEPTEPSEEPTEPTEPTEEPTEPDQEPTEPSEEPTEPSEEPTEPEKPEYVYPDDWSRPALMFAVENGILQGDQNHNLNPEKNISRVQMAAVLTRLLGATGTADLTIYTDVDPNAWYCAELSAAVAAGIFNGTSATSFAPNASLTREQAMVVLSRAFGIATENSDAYKEFTDGESVSEYARYAVGAMKELGLVNGYTDGSVKPQKTITRAEVAQLLFNLFDTIANTPDEISEEGRVLYRGTDPLPAELTVKGTLILANGTPTDLEILNWNIEDTLVIRTQDGIDMELSGLTAGRLVICAVGKVTASIDRVWLGGKGVEYTGDATYLGSLLGTHKATGNYESVLIQGGSIDIDGTAVDLELNPSCGVTLNSSCRTITTGQKSNITIGGDCESAVMGNLSVFETSGSCNSLTLKDFAKAAIGGDCETLEMAEGTEANITGNCTTVTSTGPAVQVTVGGNCETLTLSERSKAIIAGNCTAVTTTGPNTQVNILGGCETLTTDILATIAIDGSCTTVNLGAWSTLTLGGDSDSITMQGFSKVTAKGHVKLITMAAQDILVLDGTADSIVVEKIDANLSGTGRAKLITIYDKGCICTLAADTINNIWYDTYGRDYENALSEVQTMRVACTVQKDTFLCANQNLTNYLVALPKGAIVYNEWHPAGDVFRVSYTDKNGKLWYGWTDRWACYIPDDTITTNGNLDYSDATKEGWVDGKGYDSATDYLVWVSRYTQKVIVFQGSKGNWKVVKTMPCSSGENNTPTPAGSFTIYSRTSRWDFDYYYTSYVSIFNGGHAFHSILMNYDHTINDDRVGIPLSHGCIRMLMEDCKYIYNLPMGTRVIVW